VGGLEAAVERSSYSRRVTLDGTRGDVLRLEDGRALAYAEWGKREGRRVFFLQGTPGGRLTQWWEEESLAARDIHLVTVDRPGIGRSDAKPGRSVADWAADLEQLARHLGPARFAVVGFSSGGPYAVACAAQLADRVSAVALVSPLGRADMPGVIDDMATVRYMRLARRSPRMMGLIYSVVARKGRKDPDAAHERFFRGASRVDRAVVDRPEVKSRWMPAFVEAAHGGGRGLAEDMRVVQRPWGFEPADVRMPVRLWHGRRDRIAPPSHAERWIEELPNCRAVWFDDEGHFLIQDHMDEILEAVLTPSDSPDD
jgi:pimeloyl-ACP methyl ester carboxylesterase